MYVEKTETSQKSGWYKSIRDKWHFPPKKEKILFDIVKGSNSRWFPNARTIIERYIYYIKINACGLIWASLRKMCDYFFFHFILFYFFVYLRIPSKTIHFEKYKNIMSCITVCSKCGSYQYGMFYGRDYDFYENRGFGKMIILPILHTHTHTVSNFRRFLLHDFDAVAQRLFRIRTHT